MAWIGGITRGQSWKQKWHQARGLGRCDTRAQACGGLPDPPTGTCVQVHEGDTVEMKLGPWRTMGGTGRERAEGRDARTQTCGLRS